ncbi:hypothetical protein [Microterricola gilva]|uniref:hypothetical protein n=1 Tax=Microterricola gilva TaxID=393267 RepID=UPI00102C4814|nr:hypothetical protein [Microterricola gilva]
MVAAGVLGSATFSTLIDPTTWNLGLIPFALTLATVVAATVSLWPVAIPQPTGRALVDTWVDSVRGAEELEDYLLEMKAVEIEFRDVSNQRRARATKAGFVLLIAALSTALIVAALTAMIEGGNNEQEQRAPAPTRSTTESRTPGTASNLPIRSS